MSIFWHRRPGIVNVRMVITEEKILSNIDKIQKMINPNNKKQIVQLDEDAYFKDLIDSIKSKRYTRSRIQRILLYALLNITKKDIKDKAVK